VLQGCQSELHRLCQPPQRHRTGFQRASCLEMGHLRCQIREPSWGKLKHLHRNVSIRGELSRAAKTNEKEPRSPRKRSHRLV
jgi:hypothetical protein